MVYTQRAFIIGERAGRVVPMGSLDLQPTLVVTFIPRTLVTLPGSALGLKLKGPQILEGRFLKEDWIGSGLLMRRLSLGLITLLAFAGPLGALGTLAQCASAQTSPAACPPTTAPAADQNASVAGAARTSKKPTVHAKRVIDDDDLELHRGPIPRLNLEGIDNVGEIVAAIRKYRESHTPQQTEQVVRDWYGETNDVLTAAIRESSNLRDLRQSSINNSNDLCQDSGDWEQCQKLRLADARGARSDQNRIANDSMMTGRIQQAFQKIRTEIQATGLRYDWFKIQNANGVGSF